MGPAVEKSDAACTEILWRLSIHVAHRTAEGVHPALCAAAGFGVKVIARIDQQVGVPALSWGNGGATDGNY